MVKQSAINFESVEEQEAQAVQPEKILVQITGIPYKNTVEKFKSGDSILLTEVKTQLDAVLYHMQKEGSITSWDGFKDWGITRLSSIIHSLRHEYFIEIESEDMTTTNRFGNVTKCSNYKLKKDSTSL